MNKPTLSKKITYEKVRKEVIQRQSKFGTGDPDIAINEDFKGIPFKYMVVLLNYWPKCDECQTYADLEIEFKEKHEIPVTLLYIAVNMLED